MTNPVLTNADVRRLLRNPSAATRTETAVKVATHFNRGRLSERELLLIEDIFRLMVKDAEIRVRAALSANLKKSKSVPRDIALTLAHDVDEVALPILQFSEVLTDQELLAIVLNQDSAKQSAIARRAKLPGVLSDALIEHGDIQAIISLIRNNGADISENGFKQAIDKFGHAKVVQAAMISRRTLPVTISERLVTLVSDKFRLEIAKRHHLPLDLTSDVILQSRERAVIGLSVESSEQEVQVLVEHILRAGRLTPSLILRALCMGDLLFFEVSMAKLAKIPMANTRTLIHDFGELGLSAIYEHSGLPPQYFFAVRMAINVLREMGPNDHKVDHQEYSRRVIKRILTRAGNLGVEFASDDLRYLLDKMSDLADG